MTNTLLYILLAMSALVLLAAISRLLRVKVMIYSRTKRNPGLVNIGYMNDNDPHQVPEVHLSGQAKGHAIGRIKIGDNDDNAYVEILTTDGTDDSVKPQYRTVGYVSQEGYIFKQAGKNKKPEKIGYTAKPSNPAQPSATGERTWRSLWLKCTINAYRGIPDDKARKRQPIAVCCHRSFHSSTHDAMPPETRAAAFATLFSLYNKKDYREYYNSPTYGWKDTALLSAFIYAILFVAWYFGRHIFGYIFGSEDIVQPVTLYAIYFALWGIVRSIKIECVENSNTIQPKIDLFNKTLGQRGFDTAIVLCCIVATIFCGTYYNIDFIALPTVLMTAVIINMTLRSSSAPWEIKNPYAGETTDEDDDDEIVNPSGDITRNFKWSLDSENVKDVDGELTLFFDAQYISDLRYVNPFYSQRKDKPIKAMVLDMFHYMKEHKSITARLIYVSSQIQKIARQKGLSVEDSLQFTLDFVQEPNIRFCMNRDSKAINQYEDYVRFPDEVFYDKEADSNSKALLAAMLFHYMNHNVLYLVSSIQHHGAIGIEVDKEWIDGNSIFGKNIDDVTFEHGGKRYIFCETTSDGFRIGGTMEGMRFEDFNEQVELPLIEKDIDDTNDDTITCIYNWDLDSELGNSLHGSYTLEFDQAKISDLRSNNPFKDYCLSTNTSTYDENIRKMFDFLLADAERMSAVREIASYISRRIDEAGLGDLDRMQFALDFCQAPNINYCIDEHSAGICYAKEYMRFPDEVLCDKEGDCDCKSSLTAALLHELGYNVIIMLSTKLKHAAIGVEGKSDWLPVIKPDDPQRVAREYNGRTYLYCETTGDGYRVGHIKDNESIQDFDTVVEIDA
ncbi:MAG: hypothetical protein NC111_04515 [Bacteroides sp.]|nr:hypothetical protein [Bacteroides sp.]MCM1413066.1 hypothetical protein [Bacteroides sp.]MCM1471772.1 hypothetical protein [Bacteroides sp.]